MAKTKVEPTEAELAILRVLWEQGESTVRDVHEALGGNERSRYTTTLKQLQVMATKKLVKRDESKRSHVYKALLEQTATERSLVSNLLHRILDGSVKKMVLHALESGDVSDDELADIQQTIEQWEKRK